MRVQLCFFNVVFHLLLLKSSLNCNFVDDQVHSQVVRKVFES